MKKIFISLLLFIVIFLGSKIDVYAKTYTDKFIISEEIQGISYAKVKNGKTEYRKAIFKRRVSDNKVVYCIEPFVDMIEDSNYNGYDYNFEKLLNLSKEDWTKINLLSYYGYGYKGHTDSKWYPITQILIWKTIDKNATFYWTKTFKGEKVARFQNEMKELEELVENHFVKPSFDNQIINTSVKKDIILEDKNNVLNNYIITNQENSDIKIDGNKLIISKQEEEKEIIINLEKRDNIYKVNPIIYVSNTYQNLLSIGSYQPVESNLSIKIESGTLKINKLDEESKSTIPQGEGTLIGTKFNLYHNNELYSELVINENNVASMDKLPYGNYKLIEIESGNGYQINNNEYYFTIDENNKNIELDIYNKVIKRKVKLYKFIENKDLLKKEGNIIFEIYNKDNLLIKEVQTNEDGEVEFELPYGTYTVKQINTTEGYKKVKDFKIEVLENEDTVLEYFLYDVKVPETNQNDYTHIYIIILFISTTILGTKLIYEKKYL